MIKVIALLARKPGMSREDFIRYYESNHVPLVRKLLPYMADYRRSYIGETVVNPPNPMQVEFDVITELWFTDSERYEAFLAAAHEPETAARIAQDEEAFLDRSRIQLISVDERS